MIGETLKCNSSLTELNLRGDEMTGIEKTGCKIK